MAEEPKRLQRAKPPDARTARPRCDATLALSSGEAARHCLVSTATISNWIAEGHLPAQRTRGGQYRIWVDDLRAFMAEHGMRTDSLERELGLVPTCWEFWTSIDRTSPIRPREPACQACPVHRSHADVCHEVRPLLPGGTVRAPSCVDCLYFATVRRVDPDDS
jgi:excisionase family DNA binding protein